MPPKFVETCGVGCWQCIKKHAFGMVMLACLVAAIIAGIVVRSIVEAQDPSMLNVRVAMQVGFIGELYVRALNSIALPLLMFSLIYSIGALEMRHVFRFGCSFLLYMFVTKLVAICVVVAMTFAMRPGLAVPGRSVPVLDASNPKEVVGISTMGDHYLDIVRNVFPGNVVEMTVHQSATFLTPKNRTDGTTAPVDEWEVGSKWVETTEFLAVAVISIVVGASFNSYRKAEKEIGALMTRLVYCFSEMTMLITKWVHRAAPIGLFFLIAEDTFNLHADRDGLVARFALTLVLCTIIQLQLTYAFIYAVVVRKSPFAFLAEILEANLTALATKSNIAALPVAIRVVEDRLRFDERLARFILPLGAIFNNDGDLIYLCVSSFFIADLYNVPLSASNIATVALLSLVASLANNGVPRGVVMNVWVFVLPAIGVEIDARGAALLFLSNLMYANLRNYVNVSGDCYGLAVVIGLNRKTVEGMAGEEATE